jgi:LCP family protein required for cell wall assembly
LTPIPPSASPTASATPTLPPPAEPLALPEGVRTLLILGTDAEAPYAGRTDTIILVFYHAGNGAASLVSVPRDLYVVLPGGPVDRINAAYPTGGIDSLKAALEYNLGVNPEHWVLLHLSDFRRLVDDLGGIDLLVERALPGDCGGIPEGWVHLGGEAALCYVRERKTGSDYERARRQQEALLALGRRFVSLDGLANLVDWYFNYAGTVHTDLGLDDLLALAPAALRIEQGQIHRFAIGGDQVTGITTGEGAAVLLPQAGAIRSLLQEAIEKAGASPAP